MASQPREKSSVGERGARKAALAVLAAHADGKPAEIPADHKAWFEEQVAAQSVSDGALKELARARATRTRAALEAGQGVGGERLVIDDVTDGDLAAHPNVVIVLGSGR